MLEVYSPRKNIFEIYDKDLHDSRDKRFNRVRMVMILAILITLVIIFFVIRIIISFNLLPLFGIIIGIGIDIYIIKNILLYKERLDPKISSLVVTLDEEKKVSKLSKRKWLEGSINDFEEDDIRFNQAIGFKVKWYDDGQFVIEILVDASFPGDPIFQTYDFYSVAELHKTLELVLPDLEEWYYELEDGSSWPEDTKSELEEEISVARVSWKIKNFVTTN